MDASGNRGRSLLFALVTIAAAATSSARSQPVEIPLFRGATLTDALAAPDGGVIVIGNQAFIDAVPVGQLAALDAGAMVNPAWSHSISGTPQRLVRDPVDGSVLMIGAFDAVDGEPRSGIARFAANGSLQPWQAHFTGVSGSAIVRRAAALVNGDIVALVVVQGSPDQGLFRIDRTTGVASLLWSVQGGVSEVLALSNDEVVVAGAVSAIGGTPINSVARLAGPGLSPQNLLTAPPASIATLDRDAADGSWYVASGSSVLRFSASGQLDPGWRVDADGAIDRVKVDGAQGVLLSGGFSRIAGVPRARVARIRKDAPLADTAWVPPAVRGRAGALTIEADRVVLGGNLVSVEAGQVGLVVLSRSTALPVAQAQRRRFGVTSASVQPGHLAVGLANGDVIVTGVFTHTTDAVLSGIARIDRSGALRRDWAPRIGGLTQQLALGDDGNLYLSGLLAIGGDLLQESVIRVDVTTGIADPAWRVPITGSSSSTFALGTGFVHLFQPTGPAIGDREIVRWSLSSPATLDAGWRAPAREIANVRALQPPRADGSMLYTNWVGCCVDFDPPPPPGQGLPMLRVTGPAATAVEPFGPVLAPGSNVAELLIDSAGRIYASGALQVDGEGQFRLLRLLPDGRLDDSFLFRSTNQYTSGPIALDPQGDHVYAALAERAPTNGTTVRAARFDTATGALDLDWTPTGMNGFPVDITFAGNRVFAVADWWTPNGGMMMMTAAFFDTSPTPLFGDGFETATVSH